MVDNLQIKRKIQEYASTLQSYKSELNTLTTQKTNYEDMKRNIISAQSKLSSAIRHANVSSKQLRVSYVSNI